MLRSVLPEPVGPTTTNSRLVGIVVIIVALEIVEIAHHLAEDRTFTLHAVLRRIVLVRSIGLCVDFARISAILVSFIGSGQLEEISPVAKQVEER